MVLVHDSKKKEKFYMENLKPGAHITHMTVWLEVCYAVRGPGVLKKKQKSAFSLRATRDGYKNPFG